MLAYAPRADRKQLRPATLGLIILGHAGLLAVVMTAKSGINLTDPFATTEVTLIEEIKPVPPTPPQPRPNPQPNVSQLDTVDPIVPPSGASGPTVAEIPGQAIPLGPTIGTGIDLGPPTLPIDPPIVRKGPRLATTGDALRPPYPDSMRQSGDEASLRLRLTIDERGRVTSVDPIGRADPTFLAAARRHILRVWRYQPAMDGDTAIPSTTTVTLKFQLGNA